MLILRSSSKRSSHTCLVEKLIFLAVWRFAASVSFLPINTALSGNFCVVKLVGKSGEKYIKVGKSGDNLYLVELECGLPSTAAIQGKAILTRVC